MNTHTLGWGWLALPLLVLTLAGPASARAGERLLPGTPRKAIAGTVTLRVPTGFVSWSEGQVFRVARKKGEESLGRLTLSAFPSDARLEEASPTEVLGPLGEEVLADVEMRHSGLTRLYWEDREAPRIVKLPGGEAGRLVRGAPARDGTPLTFFVAALRAKGWVYLLGGVWPSTEDGRLLPAADTLLHTLQVRPPRENAALKKKLLGCWDLVPGKGSKSTRGRYVFEAEGHYRYEGEVAITLPGAEGFGSRDEHGSYRVHGKEIFTRNDHGEPGLIPFRLQGAQAQLGGARYRRCPQGAEPPAGHDEHDGHDHDGH
ncbi:MAG: hypothetical protein P1V51_17420 [Deltaproteobacteria bacterium]|nr:hypothetical protein [Deltaproteobacteria bacterium]